jgi:hypothetical protein
MPTLARRVQVTLHSPGTVPRVIFDSSPGGGEHHPPPVVPPSQVVSGVGAILSAETFGTIVLRTPGVVSGIGAITAPGTVGFGEGPFGEGPFGGDPAFGAIRLVYKQIVSGVGAISTGETFGTTKFIRREKNVGAVGSLEAFGITTLRWAATKAFQLDAFQTDEAGASHAIGNIPSAEAFGTPAVRRIMKNVGAVSTSEAFGSITVIKSHAFQTTAFQTD